MITALSRLLGNDTEPSRPRIEPTVHLPTRAEQPVVYLSDPVDKWEGLFGLGLSQSFGPPISERTAMACSAVFRCVQILAGITATLPLKVYRRTADGREEVAGDRLSEMLRKRPNRNGPLSSYAWREMWMVNMLLWGNHYSIIRYDNAGRIIAFEVVMPWAVEVLRSQGRNFYRCLLEDGRVETVHQDDMIHIAGPGFDGIKGLSRIAAFARNSIALASVAEQQSGRTFENASRPSGFMEVPPNISEPAFRRMKAQFGADHAGWENSGRVIWGDVGSKYTPFQISAEDIAMIETRRFQIADISRFYGIPLHMLNETEKSTSWGTGISEQTLGLLIFTVDPDLSRIEAELNMKLFLPGDDRYVEYDRDALLAMDPVKAAEVAKSEVAMGGLLINEWRRKKNRPPVEGGDVPLINSTNIPLKQAIEGRPQQQPAAQPGAAA